MKKVADQVAQELGIDEVHSELLPADKVTQVERLLDEKKENEKNEIEKFVYGNHLRIDDCCRFYIM